MVLADRLRAIRAQKHLSQGDIAKSTGLLRCYLSRVENGHTVPSIETLEKLALALSIPMYQLFYDGDEPPSELVKGTNERGWGNSGKDAGTLGRFRRLLSRTSPRDMHILMTLASKMARRK
jgi:transcriptional regulator with XRE-family HTH domain